MRVVWLIGWLVGEEVIYRMDFVIGFSLNLGNHIFRRERHIGKICGAVWAKKDTNISFKVMNLNCQKSPENPKGALLKSVFTLEYLKVS